MEADERRDAAVWRSPHLARSNGDATSGDEPSPGIASDDTLVAGGERLPSSAGGTCRRSRRQSAARGGGSAEMLPDFLWGEQGPTPPPSTEEPRPGQADVYTPKRRKRVSLSCGKATCGATEAWPTPCPVCPGNPVHSGNLLCCACHRRPPDARGSESLFRHLPDDDAVADAAELWNKISATGAAAKTAIVPGWVPSRECLCFAPDCFYALRRREKLKEQRAAAKCVACWRAPKSDLMRAGEKFRLKQEFFRATDAGAMHRGGESINLNADSRLCKSCVSRFSREVESTLFKRGEDGKWTVHQYLLRLDTSDAPEINDSRGALAIASHIATRNVVAEIAAGRLVDLGDAMDIVRQARSEAGSKDIAERALSNDAARILDQVASAVSGVHDLSFSGGEVGQDERRKFRVLMPLVFDEWFIANLYASERELRRERTWRETALLRAAEQEGVADAPELHPPDGGDEKMG
ncbi:unnamed protein product [Sphacelaria rigidula]